MRPGAAGALVLAAPALVRLPAWLAGLSDNPIWIWSGVAAAAPPLIDGLPGYIDPNAGWTTQALGTLAARQWLHGEVPWWDPFSGVGMPLAAEMQSSALFLPYILLLLLPAGWALFNLSLQWTAGLCTWRLGRALGLGQAASATAGVLFELSASFAWLGPPMSLPIAFLPMFLLGLERARAAASAGQPGGWRLIAGAVAWSIVAGFPETAYLDGLLALVWAVARLASHPRRLAYAARVAGGGGVGLLLAAPALWPFLDLLGQASLGRRGTLDMSALVLLPQQLVLFLQPYALGLPTMFSIAGPLPLWSDLWARVGGFASPALVLAALLGACRPGPHRALRLVLLGWTALVMARMAGVPGATGAFDLIPFHAQLQLPRYAGGAWQMPLCLLAAFAVDGARARPRLTAALMAGLFAAGLFAAGALAAAAALPLTEATPAAQPWLIASSVWGAATLGAAALAFAAGRRRAIPLLLMADAALLFAPPLLAGRQHGAIDQPAVDFLQQRLGAQRFASLGPIGPNYGALFGIASVNSNYLPSPALWADHIVRELWPGAEAVLFAAGAGQPGQSSAAAAMASRLAAYRALGTRYVVAWPGPDPLDDAAIGPSPSGPGSQASALMLRPGEPVTGTLAADDAEVEAVGVTIGTYFGRASGELQVELCGPAGCAVGRAPLAGAADNRTLRIPLDHPAPGADAMRWSLVQPSGSPAALWRWPGPDGPAVRVAPLYARPGGLRPVYADRVLAIFELGDPAPYASIARGGPCTIDLRSRTRIDARCAAPALLVRRELDYPGWRVRIAGVDQPVGHAPPLFQSASCPPATRASSSPIGRPNMSRSCCCSLPAPRRCRRGGLWAGRSAGLGAVQPGAVQPGHQKVHLRPRGVRQRRRRRPLRIAGQQAAPHQHVFAHCEPDPGLLLIAQQRQMRVERVVRGCARSGIVRGCARSGIVRGCARSGIVRGCARSGIVRGCARSGIVRSCARSGIVRSCARSRIVRKAAVAGAAAAHHVDQHLRESISRHRAVRAALHLEVQEQPAIARQDRQRAQRALGLEPPQGADLLEAGPVLVLQHHAGGVAHHDPTDHLRRHHHAQRQWIVLQHPRHVRPDRVCGAGEVADDLVVGPQVRGGRDHHAGRALVHRGPRQAAHRGEAGGRDPDDDRPALHAGDEPRCDRERLRRLQLRRLAHDAQHRHAVGAACKVVRRQPVDAAEVERAVRMERRGRDRIDAVGLVSQHAFHPTPDPRRTQALRDLLLSMFHAAVAAADPALCAAHLPPPPPGRTVVVGAGKAAAAMAQAVDQAWPADRPLSGLVVTRYGHGVGTLPRIAVVEAGHPVPDAAGTEAARRILALAAGLGPDDLLLCLVSGGGSSLLALPAEGLPLADKQAVSRALLRSGAPIDEFNVVRKHLSAIKGGRLAQAAAPAQVFSLMISDVPGDDPSVIASGPTMPDASTTADARAVLARYGVAPPASVAAHLMRPEAETPKPGDPGFARVSNIVYATPQRSLDAAAAVARRAGVQPLVLGDAIEGEASEVARVMAAIARQAAVHGQPAPPPCVLISGGETTVTVRGQGRGGRNAEFLLALAVALDGRPGIHAIAADTDGIDGTEDNAGAILAPDALARARALGLDPRARLRDNDGYGVFAALGDLVVTGPTRTNVNDFRAIVIQSDPIGWSP